MANIVQPFHYQMQSTVAPWSLSMMAGWFLAAIGSVMLLKGFLSGQSGFVAVPAACVFMGAILAKKIDSIGQ